MTRARTAIPPHLTQAMRDLDRRIRVRKAELTALAGDAQDAGDPSIIFGVILVCSSIGVLCWVLIVAAALTAVGI